MNETEDQVIERMEHAFQPPQYVDPLDGPRGLVWFLLLLVPIYAIAIALVVLAVKR